MKHSNTLLLAIDFINEICHPDGKIASCAEMVTRHHIVERVNKVITHARSHHIPVAHVKVGFQSNYANCPAQSPIFGKAPHAELLKLDSWGTEFLTGMDVRAEDFIIIKSRISPFYNTPLETLLHAKEIRHIVVAGVSTAHAVESTVREAHDRDYIVTVLGDCCATASDEIHAATLKGVMSHMAHITTAQEWMKS